MRHRRFPHNKCCSALCLEWKLVIHKLDVSKFVLVGLQTELCHILRDDDLGPHLPHHSCPDVEDLRVWPSHPACRMSCGPCKCCQLCVCVRMDYTALFAVRDAPGCHRHVIGLLQQGTRTFGICLHALMSEMHCRTQFGAMLARLSKQHPGVAEWARITFCASKSHSQAHKLRIRIGESHHRYLCPSRRTAGWWPI